jgi:hypothetical protein
MKKEEVRVNVLEARKYQVSTYDLYINVAEIFEGRKGNEVIEVQWAHQERMGKTTSSS